MLELEKIHIQNLASIENQTYYFHKQLNTIIGINKDTSNIDKNISNEDLLKLPLINLKSNGSGKTTIIEALHICLLGGCIKEKTNTRELIRQGASSTRIELICKNIQMGLSQIRIVREIFANKSKTSKLQLFETKEGKEEIEIPKSTSDNMDAYVLNNYIGLSKEDIDNFFIIQRDKFKSFLLLPDQKKKDILSRFTGISNFSFIENNLIEEQKELEEQKIEKDKNISKKQGQIESFQEILNNTITEDVFKKKQEERIATLGAKIKEEEDSIKKKNKKKEEIKKEQIHLNNLIYYIWEGRLEKYNKYIKEHPFDTKNKEIEKLEKDYNNIKGELEEIKEAIQEAENLQKDKNKSLNQLDIVLNKLETLLDNLVECPNCKFKFNPKGNTSKEYLEEKLLQSNNKEAKLKRAIKEIDNDLKELNHLLKNKKQEYSNLGAKIETKEREIRKKQRRITKIGDYIKSQIDEYNSIFEELNKELKREDNSIKFAQENIFNYNEQIRTIKKEKYESLISENEKYKENINKLNKEIINIEQEKENINKEIQISKDCSLSYNLFKNYLYNKIITEIEYIVNNYLQKFSDLSVTIKGNKTLADGKSVRDEINCVITRSGKEISYFLLSSGEKAFIDVAFILTFQKILNITSHNGFNFLILDEITGTVDCANQEELLVAINALEKPILFITHIPTISDFKTTYIIKENNKSYIIQ